MAYQSRSSLIRSWRRLQLIVIMRGPTTQPGCKLIRFETRTKTNWRPLRPRRRIIEHLSNCSSANLSPKLTLLFEPRRQRLLEPLPLDFEPLPNSRVDIFPRGYRSIETTLFRHALTGRRSMAISLRSSHHVSRIGVTQFAASLDHDNPPSLE
jgi:hypothetical protein